VIVAWSCFGAQGEVALVSVRRNRGIFLDGESFADVTRAPELCAAGRSCDLEGLR
jgi:hypothetical protein